MLFRSEDRLEVLGLDHPLVDQIEDRIYDPIYKKIPFDQEELIEMSNEITKAIKELNR